MKIRYTIMEGDRQREKNLIRANDLKSPKRQVRYISVSVCVGGGGMERYRKETSDRLRDYYS